jgi:hypothetical protein
MAVNVSKTKFIIFHTRGKRVNDNIKILYDDNEPDMHDPTLVNELERVHNNHHSNEHQSYKLLGIHLDEHLSFDHHTKYLCSKLNKSLFCINRAKRFLPSNALKTLYYSLVHSHLSYCTPILSCASNHNIQLITKVQKKAIRTITNSTYLAHTEPLFNQLKILSFPALILYSNVKLMHSVMYEYSPPSFRNIWHRNEHRDINHDLRNANDLIIPHARIELFKKSLLFQLPTAWNSLDIGIQLQHNKFTFNHALKEHLQNGNS